MTVQSYGKKASAANILAMQKIIELEQLLSTTNALSEIFTLNAEADSAQGFVEAELSAQTAFLIDFSLKTARETGGALNPCLYPVVKEWGFTTGDYKVPEQERITELLAFTDFSKVELRGNHIRLPARTNIDLGAVGKGFAGDKAVEILMENGIFSAILDLGGNVQTLGKRLDGSLWRIGIKNPMSGSPFAVVSVEDNAVITSGGYERYFTDADGNTHIHIFDGATGHPVQNNLISVSIIARSGLYADALSTSLFVMGIEKASDFWRNKKDFDLIMLTDDGGLFYTEGIQDDLRFLEEFSELTVIK